MAMTDKTRRELRAIRAAMVAAGGVVAEMGGADDVIRSMVCFDAWKPDDYTDKLGEVRLYEGYPYKVYQPHDSTANPGWTPEAYPAGWTPYHGTTAETALPYRQPTGAHDMYKAGEYMIWTGGAVYLCKQDTAYSPEAYAQAWERVTEEAEPVEPSEPDQPDNPNDPDEPATPTYTAWVQPTGGHDAYAKGDRVADQGKVWESTVDGNVWKPGVYGWVEVTE